MHPLLSYLKFLLQAGNAHGLHSPFVYALYTELVSAHQDYYAFEEIEALRDQLAQDQGLIEVLDLGTGQSGARAVAQIARRSLAPPKVGQLLFKLVNHFQPQTIVELGTSLGITTLYLASPCPAAQVYTFEGSPALADRAMVQFAGRATNIELIRGSLDETLAPTLAGLPGLDFGFLDANHRGKPTLRYFEQCLAHTHQGSVLVLDDIHWSAEMEQAWAKIQQHPAVTLTVDLFRVGLVFFRKNQPKQHFKLRW
jgi:predicted O-methyltransferase YrrM